MTAVGGVNALHAVTWSGRPSGTVSRRVSCTSVPRIGHQVLRCTFRTAKTSNRTNTTVATTHRLALAIVIMTSPSTSGWCMDGAENRRAALLTVRGAVDTWVWRQAAFAPRVVDEVDGCGMVVTGETPVPRWTSGEVHRQARKALSGAVRPCRHAAPRDDRDVVTLTPFAPRCGPAGAPAAPSIAGCT
jgi:hypothetical protein